MSFLDYVHVMTTFLVSNDKNIYRNRKNQGKKLHNLFLNNSYHNSVTSLDSDKVIFIFLGHVLHTTEKSLLKKGLNFAIPTKNINYADYMLPFELLYRDVSSLEVSPLIMNLSKVGLETLLFHHTRILVKLLRRTYPKRNLMH